MAELSVLVEKVVGIMYLIIAVSLVWRSKFWMEAIEDFKSRPSQAYLMAYIGLPFGLVIILLHNEWILSVTTFVTLLGWIALIKSILYLLFPDDYVRMLPKKKTLQKMIRIQGPIMAVICILIIYEAFKG